MKATISCHGKPLFNVGGDIPDHIVRGSHYPLTDFPFGPRKKLVTDSHTFYIGINIQH